MEGIEQEMKELEEAFHPGGIISFFLAIFIGCFLNKMCPRFKWDQSPPGPAEFRGVGNLHQVARGNSTLDKIQRWRAIYGDVIALSLSHYKMVILSGYETIRAAYNTPEFSGRILLKPFHTVGGFSKIVEQGDLALAMPKDKDVLQRLGNFAVGNVSEVVMVHQNVGELVGTVRKLQGRPVVPHKMLTESVVKSMTSVVSKKMMSSDDPHFQSVLENVQSIISSASISSGPGFFLSTFFPNVTNSIEKAKNVILGNSHEDKDPFLCAEVENGIMNAYLMDVGQIQKSGKTLLKNTNDVHSVADVLNLLAATSESTSNTIIWALYYLIKDPQVQEQLYEELYAVMGKKRSPSLDDLSSCPVTQAIIEEVFRITSQAPLGYFHRTSDDVMFQGHLIPKNTLVCSNVYALHNDRKVWGDAEIFRPSRFLCRDPATGQLHRNLDAGPVIPFSVSRTSLGEVVTRNCTFLYLTSLIQKFQFSTSSPDDKQQGLGNVESGTALMRAPKEFNIVARERY